MDNNEFIGAIADTGLAFFGSLSITEIPVEVIVENSHVAAFEYALQTFIYPLVEAYVDIENYVGCEDERKVIVLLLEERVKGLYDAFGEYNFWVEFSSTFTSGKNPELGRVLLPKRFQIRDSYQ